MTLSRLFILSCTLTILQASVAGAVVSVTHTNDAVGAVPVGGTFNVMVTAAYDGTPVLTGIFTSAMWDPAQLMLTGTTAPPFTIFFGSGGFLSKIADPTSFPGDPAGSIRTIQFGANPGQSAGAGAPTLITTLTFQVLAAGSGTAAIDVAFLSGDVFSGALGVALLPPDTSIVGTVVSVPEPGSFAMAFASLGTVGLIVRRRAGNA